MATNYSPTVKNKPHAVCIPWPPLPATASLPDFRFETFSDGVSTSPDADTPPEPFALCESSRRNFLTTLRVLVNKINNSSREGVPAVTCIVSDGVMPFTTVIAKEIGVPCMVFWVVSACGFMGYKHHRQIKERGLLPLNDGNKDTIMDWIPGLKGTRLRDIPHVEYVNYDFPTKEAEEAVKASGIILNTFETLEKHVLDAITSMHPHVYPIGPIHMLLNSIEEKNGALKSIASNLWEEELHCLQWLNSMRPNSVVYISFGTSVFLTPDQLTEFAWGISNSNHPFLWIIRPDLVVAGDGEGWALPPVFLENTRERGLIASWCPQEKVLNHSSIGGFFTSCGWNSVLESISAGRGSGEACERVDGEREGKRVEEKAMEWKEMVGQAISTSGSSTLNFDNLVVKLMSS
ncbi:UDP-Glycosyltransferase superfamily protein [Actinidia rufa]|uniref:UDP-Glycosyltransferase superfamily protein n=1 Tax=Actinidia rufa TaxID=165716 RepID=A0A7J0G041_9ERIC|nr:UDP-Glycosyltransferase superfamily protein [Actinidia rufa]